VLVKLLWREVQKMAALQKAAGWSFIRFSNFLHLEQFRGYRGIEKLARASYKAGHDGKTTWAVKVSGR